MKRASRLLSSREAKHKHAAFSARNQGLFTLHGDETGANFSLFSPLEARSSKLGARGSSLGVGTSERERKSASRIFEQSKYLHWPAA